MAAPAITKSTQKEAGNKEKKRLIMLGPELNDILGAGYRTVAVKPNREAANMPATSKRKRAAAVKIGTRAGFIGRRRGNQLS
jgi:hypothetical protein